MKSFKIAAFMALISVSGMLAKAAAVLAHGVASLDGNWTVHTAPWPSDSEALPSRHLRCKRASGTHRLSTVFPRRCHTAGPHDGQDAVVPTEQLHGLHSGSLPSLCANRIEFLNDQLHRHDPMQHPGCLSECILGYHKHQYPRSKPCVLLLSHCLSTGRHGHARHSMHTVYRYIRYQMMMPMPCACVPMPSACPCVPSQVPSPFSHLCFSTLR